MLKTGFVILHYMTIKDTIRCVNSIINKVGSSPIVIVDNASINDSGKTLYSLYKNESKIDVILLKNNLGFARGNNEGIKFIKDKYRVDFVVVLNNDTLLLNEDFLEVINEEYEESKFACLGPKIVDKNGDTGTNPVACTIERKIDVIILIIKRLIKLGIVYLFLESIIRRKSFLPRRENALYDNSLRYENVKLHGSCWIFSPIFFEKFDGIDKRTFLFFEEDIMFLKLSNRKLKSVYNPKICIKHFEDSATNSINSSSRDKLKFVLVQELKSLFVVLRVLNEEKSYE